MGDWTFFNACCDGIRRLLSDGVFVVNAVVWSHISILIAVMLSYNREEINKGAAER